MISTDWLDEFDYICPSDVGEPFLARMVEESITEDPDLTRPCSLCGDPGRLVEELLPTIKSAVYKFYDRAIDAGVPFDDGDFVFPVTDTEDVLEGLGIGDDSPLHSAAVQHIGPDAWVRDPNLIPDEERLLYDGWKAFREHVVHRSRFLFDTMPSSEWYGAFDSLGTLDFLEQLLDAVLARQPTLALGPDSVIYRARVFEQRGTHPQEARGYTSPPAELAAQGRMNPAGIPYFYGALDAETAAVEVYNGSAGYAAVASFVSTRPLMLVDLQDSKIPSPFDASVSRPEHLQALFLKGFTADIARPIVRDDKIHQEYGPTQAVTEYLRFKAEPRLDGLAFSSARGDGTNVVLFANQDQCLGGSADSLLGIGQELQIVEFGPPSVRRIWVEPL